jgi:glycosyltransferase involved in cell wall biosynthesis
MAGRSVLFISSWYPNRNDPTLGIFNTYFAQAAALYNHVSVLNVSAEADLPQQMELSCKSDKGIYMVFVYYRKVTLKIPLISQILKRNRVLKAFEKGFEKLVQEKGKPHVIHLNVAMPMGIPVLHLSQKYNIPYVVNENWSGYTKEDGNYKGFVQKYFTRKIIRNAKAVLPTSTYLLEAMQSHGLDNAYTVIPNVVNVNVFRPLPFQRSETTRLIHISSLNDREKNVSGLIRAFAAAHKQQPALTLDIVGEGIDKEKYTGLVKSLGLEKEVKFLGRLFAEQLVQEINAHDALIMFSHFETFCLVIIEAFACGKPVITSDAGAIKTYMKPELGIMVPKGDEQRLAEAIFTFTKKREKFDSAAIRKFAVDHYSYEVVGQTLEAIYEKAIKAS